jgi:8-oxo-dGTP pyrophosphatase MutT (NUDIX family)
MALRLNEMRGLAVVVIKNGNKTLVSPGYDKIKDKSFYRLLGGGIDFGETSLAAIKREIKEELNVELENYKLLTITENIFTYNGDSGHEICFIYRADFKDKLNYEKKEFSILDSDHDGKVIWLDLNKENVKMIMPPGADDFIIKE